MHEVGVFLDGQHMFAGVVFVDKNPRIVRSDLCARIIRPPVDADLADNKPVGDGKRKILDRVVEFYHLKFFGRFDFAALYLCGNGHISTFFAREHAVLVDFGNRRIIYAPFELERARIPGRILGLQRIFVRLFEPVIVARDHFAAVYVADRNRLHLPYHGKGRRCANRALSFFIHRDIGRAAADKGN